jgi:hypothetical protein
MHVPKIVAKISRASPISVQIFRAPANATIAPNKLSFLLCSEMENFMIMYTMETKIPFTQHQLEALRKHGLKIGGIYRGVNQIPKMQICEQRTNLHIRVWRTCDATTIKSEMLEKFHTFMISAVQLGIVPTADGFDIYTPHSSYRSNRDASPVRTPQK